MKCLITHWYLVDAVLSNLIFLSLSLSFNSSLECYEIGVLHIKNIFSLRIFFRGGEGDGDGVGDGNRDSNDDGDGGGRWDSNVGAIQDETRDKGKG
jgi:hypothetical protein